MFDRFFGATVYAVCSIFAVLMWFLELYGSEAVIDAATGQTAAAWVQAISSVAAIAAGAAALVWQARKQRVDAALEHYEKERDQYLAIAKLVDRAQRQVLDLATSTHDVSLYSQYLDLVEEEILIAPLEQLFASFDMHNAPSVDAKMAIKICESQLRRTLDTMAEARRLELLEGVLATNLDRHRAIYENIAARLRRQIGRFEHDFVRASSTIASLHASGQADPIHLAR